MKKEKLLIVGAGGHGRVIADIAIKTELYSEIAFLDDSNIKRSLGLPVIGKVSCIPHYIKTHSFIVAIGNSDLRQKIIESLANLNANIATLIHPKSIIGIDVIINVGTVVMAGAVINSGSRIGIGVIINTGSSIDHDNIIDDYSHISVGAHLAGTVYVGKHTWIGAGAIVINNIDICENCMIGAGAVVIKNIINSGTYVGVPANKKD